MHDVDQAELEALAERLYVACMSGPDDGGVPAPSQMFDLAHQFLVERDSRRVRRKRPSVIR
jgi:hypothetical protein